MPEGLAESLDAVQEALIAAAQQWPRGGIPDNPRDWLVRVAHRCMVDQLRSEVSRRNREAASVEVRPTPWNPPWMTVWIRAIRSSFSSRTSSSIAQVLQLPFFTSASRKGEHRGSGEGCQVLPARSSHCLA